MKKLIYSILVILTFCFITGCASNPDKPEKQPENIVVSKTSYVFVSIPENLITNCKIDQPPAIKEYSTADSSVKEALLTVYTRSLLSNISVCNTKLSNLRKWNQEQKDIYDSKLKEK